MSAAERFFAKVSKSTDCWLWTAATYPSGYGKFKAASYVLVPAHRWVYEFVRGPIPDGLTIDHLCRVRRCVNPDHLEAVTQRENNRRKPVPPKCPAGHEFTAENTSIRTVNRERQWAGRKCKECDRIASREYRARKRLERAA